MSLPFNRLWVPTAAAILAPLAVVNSHREEPRPAPGLEQQQDLYQVPYNGKFTFTRIRYGSGGSGQGRGFRWGWGSAWNHDYPQADRNMQFVLEKYTRIRTNTEGSNVVDLEDPRIFQHPILYMSEPGFWGCYGGGCAEPPSLRPEGGLPHFRRLRAGPVEQHGRSGPAGAS